MYAKIMIIVLNRPWRKTNYSIYQTFETGECREAKGYSDKNGNVCMQLYIYIHEHNGATLLL